MVIKKVPLDKIQDSPWQARIKKTTVGNNGRYKAVPGTTGEVVSDDPLVKAIREHGLTSLPTLQELEGGQFRMLSGHRRTAAFHLAFPEAKAIEAVVVPAKAGMTDTDAALHTALDNAKRKNLALDERIICYQRLHHLLGTWQKVSDKLGVSLSQILRTVALQEVPAAVRQLGLNDAQLAALFEACGDDEARMLRLGALVAERKVAATKIGSFVKDHSGAVYSSEERVMRRAKELEGKHPEQIEMEIAEWRAAKIVERDAEAEREAAKKSYMTEEKARKDGAAKAAAKLLAEAFQACRASTWPAIAAALGGRGMILADIVPPIRKLAAALGARDNILPALPEPTIEAEVIPDEPDTDDSDDDSEDNAA